MKTTIRGLTAVFLIMLWAGCSSGPEQVEDAFWDPALAPIDATGTPVHITTKSGDGYFSNTPPGITVE